MDTGMTSRELARRNAVELGWHVGYYNFVLTVIGNAAGSDLGDEDRQVLSVVKERFGNLMAFFELDIDVKYPTSPAEARSLLGELESDEGFNLAATVHDALRIRKGQDISNLLSLGQQIMTYALLAQRTEPEIRPVAAEMEVSVRNAVAAAGISETIAEELLQEPARLMDSSWVLSRLFDKAAGSAGVKEQRGRVFLCHASEDKQAVVDLYNKLKLAGHRPWLDKEDLLPGQEWAKEIPKIIRSSACIVVVLSRHSVAKRGYVQKEFKLALEVVDELPENQIFLIPVLLDDCAVPDSLARFHWIRLDESGGIEKLLRSITVAEENFAEHSSSNSG